jgi:hypothetical protein
MHTKITRQIISIRRFNNSISEYIQNDQVTVPTVFSLHMGKGLF